MARDVYMRIICIPLLGVFLPLVSGTLPSLLYSISSIVLINFYFIGTSYLIWTGCNWIHSTLRSGLSPFQSLLKRILTVCIATALYGFCIGCLSALGWNQLSSEIFNWNSVLSFILACTVTVIVFTLLYEILFLGKEREQDNQKVDQLSKEKSQATLYALQNEMDPHFLFNALNTLNHLILTEPDTAHSFNNKLAQVYKYFLSNKNTELISLANELNFIEDYYYLLQLRYGSKLQLEIKLNNSSNENITIPPCSLQILLENAIKHNSFSDDDPLLILVTVGDRHIKVVNKKKPKPHLIESTHIGLNNLRSRYKLLFNRDIIISPGKENFTVNLPVIR